MKGSRPTFMITLISCNQVVKITILSDQLEPTIERRVMFEMDKKAPYKLAGNAGGYEL